MSEVPKDGNDSKRQGSPRAGRSGKTRPGRTGTDGLGRRVRWPDVVGPTINWADIVGPTVNWADIVGPTVNWAELLAPKVDWSGIALPKVDFSALISGALSASGALAGLPVKGVLASAAAFPDIEVARLAGDLPLRELLGPELAPRGSESADVVVRDVLADRVPSAALMGPEVDIGEMRRERALSLEERAVISAIVARVDQLEESMTARLGRLEVGQTFRRQLPLLLLSAMFGLLFQIGAAQITPDLVGVDVDKMPPGRVVHEDGLGDRPAQRKSQDRTRRVARINDFIQERLHSTGRRDVRAVEAAEWLDSAGLLADSSTKPGLPLRRMLRAGVIEGAQQRPNRRHGRWFIMRTNRISHG